MDGPGSLSRSFLASFPIQIPAETAARAAANDTRKEIRTLRETAISTLCHHPYVRGMREMIVHEYDYCMVFEYVNGSQMLDYIVRHGRLRENEVRATG